MLPEQPHLHFLNVLDNRLVIIGMKTRFHILLFYAFSLLILYFLSATETFNESVFKDINKNINLSSILLDKKLIMQTEKNKDSFYFNPSIKNVTQLEKYLVEILNGEDTKKLIDIWKKHTNQKIKMPDYIGIQIDLTKNQTLMLGYLASSVIYVLIILSCISEFNLFNQYYNEASRYIEVNSTICKKDFNNDELVSKLLDKKIIIVSTDRDRVYFDTTIKDVEQLKQHLEKESIQIEPVLDVWQHFCNAGKKIERNEQYEFMERIKKYINYPSFINTPIVLPEFMGKYSFLLHFLAFILPLIIIAYWGQNIFDLIPDLYIHNIRTDFIFEQLNFKTFARIIILLLGTIMSYKAYEKLVDCTRKIKDDSLINVIQESIRNKFWTWIIVILSGIVVLLIYRSIYSIPYSFLKHFGIRFLAACATIYFIDKTSSSKNINDTCNLFSTDDTPLCKIREEGFKIESIRSWRKELKLLYYFYIVILAGIISFYCNLIFQSAHSLMFCLLGVLLVHFVFRIMVNKKFAENLPEEAKKFLRFKMKLNIESTMKSTLDKHKDILPTNIAEIKIL